MEVALTDKHETLINRPALVLFAYVIYSLKFFDATFAAGGILKNLCFGVMFLAILISLPYFFKYNGGFVLAIQLICISILISFATSYMIWKQSLTSAATSIPYMSWFVFFYLLHKKVPIATIESVIIACGVIYIVLFAFQYMHPGVVYFGVRDEFTEDRGVIRIIFPGGGVFFLSCFIAINKATHASKNRIYWLVFALVGIVVVVLQVTRQLIGVVLIMYLIHFLRNSTLVQKILVGLAFGIGLFVFLNSNSPLGKGLVEQSKEDASYGKDYIRVLSAEYFITSFNESTIGTVFGNGFPNEKSDYGRILSSLSDSYGFFLTDVGIVEVYIVFGVLAIIGYTLIFVKSFTISLPDEYQYVKYYLWMLAATSFSADFLISYHYLIVTVLVLYIGQVLEQQNGVKLEAAKHTYDK